MSAILNQPWEDVADDVTGAIEKAVQPLLKKAVDDIYGGLLDATQDYLKDNLAFNIASRIDSAEREARDARQQVANAKAVNADLLEAARLLLKASDTGDPDDCVDAETIARAAIARATGTSSEERSLHGEGER